MYKEKKQFRRNLVKERESERETESRQQLFELIRERDKDRQ